MGFGKNIHDARIKAGYSKEYVAMHLGISVSNLEKYEAEKRNPPLKKAGILADLFNTTVQELMDLPEEKVLNIANIKLDPQSQESIDRINRMRQAGLTEEQIDTAIDYTIAMMAKKKPG